MLIHVFHAVALFTPLLLITVRTVDVIKTNRLRDELNVIRNRPDQTCGTSG